jgi:hypothetical protein
MATKDIAQEALFVYTPPSTAPAWQGCSQSSACGASLFANDRDRHRNCACTCYCKCAGCRQLCQCKCPPSCSCVLAAVSCCCHRMPVVILLAQSPAGSAAGQRSFLPVRWCNAEPPAHICAAISGLTDGAELRCHGQQSSVLDWQRAEPSFDGSSLLPCIEYMRQSAQSKIQASARAFLLRRHLLAAARMRLRVFEEGKMNLQLAWLKVLNKRKKAGAFLS